MQKRNGFLLLMIYGLSWVLSVGLIIYQLLRAGVAPGNLWAQMEEILNLWAILSIHVIFLILSFLFFTLRHFIRTYRKKGLLAFLKAVGLWYLLPALLLIGSYKAIIYKNSYESYAYTWDTSVENTSGKASNFFAEDGKHRGMSVFGLSRNTTKTMDNLIKNNIEWVAVTPFMYQKDATTRAMGVPEEIGMWTARDSIFIQSIAKIHGKGGHVQLKPHLWMRDGWRSNIQLPNSAAWDTWFESYRKNMIHYAKMAALAKVELLCIGTELKTSLQQQPQKWLDLITEIRAIYPGKLTYAANWDAMADFPEFWSALDYIGVQAYFPLTKNSNPDLEEIKQGWTKHIRTLEQFHEKYQRPILFTEVGYKSEASATIKPWEWGSVLSIFYLKKSDRTQQLAYEALFQRVWDKDWFAGMYIWQWDSCTSKENAYKNLDFTPRYKPAENTIAKWFGKSPNKKKP
ncbi:glycoside hydrolase family 113 [Spongiimicrobium salis]|uniref:glycoside hydrolase family 113 n=1 Tax=Spongiimicrobium salis TaxID=1667022 RepID=UPI00374D0B0E